MHEVKWKTGCIPRKVSKQVDHMEELNGNEHLTPTTNDLTISQQNN